MAEELEQELLELEQYIRDLWEFLPIPLIYFNPQGMVMDVSAALERLFHVKKEDIITRSLASYFEDQKVYQQILNEAENKQSVTDIQARLRLSTETVIDANLSVQMRRDENGKSIGYFLAINDLTNFVRMQADLKTRINDLKEFSDLAVGRELKMIELEKEVNQLLKDMGKAPKFK